MAARCLRQAVGLAAALLARSALGLRVETEPASATPPELPSYLDGHTLIVAGDSNDRLFVRQMCQWYKSDLKKITAVEIGKDNAWNTTQLIFPSLGQPSYCTIKSKGITVVNLFHYGVMEKEPWYHRFMLREEDIRFPEVPWHNTGFRRRVQITAREWSQIVWPKILEKIHKQSKATKAKPSIVMLQTSLWDAVPFVEMTKPNPSHLRRQHYNMSWRRHAGLLVDAFKHSGIAYKQLLWRTTPGCPADNKMLRAMMELQQRDVLGVMEMARSSEIHGNALEEADRWSGVKLVDWAKTYSVTGPEMCDGAHYPARGYQNLLEGLLEQLRATHRAGSL